MHQHVFAREFANLAKVSIMSETFAILLKLHTVQRAARRLAFSICLILPLRLGSQMDSAYSSCGRTSVV